MIFIVTEPSGNIDKLKKIIASSALLNKFEKELDARYFAKVQSNLNNKPLMVVAIENNKFKRLATYHPGNIFEDYSEAMKKIDRK